MVKVLILEDDLDFAGLLAESMIEEDHTVEIFSNTSKALDALEKEHFDVIVCDTFIRQDGKILPEGGLHLVSQMKQIRAKKTPIIAISGAFSNSNLAAVSRSVKTVGANAVLAKPFHPEELLKLISKLTSGRTQ